MQVEEKLCRHIKYIILFFEGQVVEHEQELLDASKLASSYISGLV